MAPPQRDDQKAEGNVINFFAHVSVGRIAVRTALVVVAALGATDSTAQITMPQPLERREVATGVYVMQHPDGSSNSAFVVTDSVVLVFDADVRSADQVLAAIRRQAARGMSDLLLRLVPLGRARR